MFAREHRHEYDPSSSPMLERPLASGRPLNVQVQGNAFGGRGLEGLRNNNQTESKIPVSSPVRSPEKLNFNPEPNQTLSKAQVSPTKSSLSSKSRYVHAQGFDPESSIWSDDEEPPAQRQLPPGKSLHRHAKSVTFDAAPPQVNEYEMTTPDPSSVASGSRDGSYDSAEEEDESFDRSSSFEREDSFDASLEDTDKTPVVLPEDWRFMSPAVANEDLAARVEDPFEGEVNSPAPLANPSPAAEARPSPTRTDSVNSNGERRPLPPLPALAMPAFPRPRSDSNASLSAAAERASSAQRNVASPPSPPSISKAEIQGMGGCTMSIEDRLRLMMIQDEDKSGKTAAEQHERRLSREGHDSSLERESQDKENGIQSQEDEAEDDDVADLGEYKLPPRISRESILRKVKSKRQVIEEEAVRLASPTPSYTHDRDLIRNLDPDTPLPSLETGGGATIAEDSVFIKQEEEDGEVDVYSIPDLYRQHLQAEAYAESLDGRDGLDGHSAIQYDDDESHYSTDSKSEERQIVPTEPVNGDEALPTPRAGTPTQTKQDNDKEANRMSLPQFAAMLGEQDFGFGLDPYLTPSPPLAEDEPVKQDVSVERDRPEQDLQRPLTPVEQLQPPKYSAADHDSSNEPSTPDSVIRHPVSESPTPDSPSVPEPVATIKAPGSKLKTRPSITPADVQAMAETRRQVSQEVPAVPPIPERHQNRPSMIMEADTSVPDPNDTNREQKSADKDPPKQQKRKSSLVPLDIPLAETDGPGFGLDKEFDRLIEAQKVPFTFPSSNAPLQPQSLGHAEYIGGQGFRSVPEHVADTPLRTQKGYLMRQNTKVVVASSASHESDLDAVDAVDPSLRGTRSAGNSPRKASQQTWTTEPWNGKIRRKSIRQSGGSPQKKPLSGPAPPLPGQASNVASSLNSVAEDQAMLNAEDLEDGAERGRLFVKVLRVKDLDLPLPKGESLNDLVTSKKLTLSVGERSYFALTLDNGLHCVTTAWLELGKTAPIGQEFELVVLNDLEFQLTLQTKLEEPKVKPIPDSPTKSVKTPKASTFSRVFASPKKRKELEMKQQEEAQKAERERQQQAQANRRANHPTAWDLLHNLVAKDGSFARSYVCLKDHESNAYGKPFTVDVPCFNEWATEDVQSMSSVKSKRSAINLGVQRKAPYRIGKLELQLLFVPKPKGAKDDDMPKSMNACIRELKEAEASSTKSWEGHLSQQGGDCPVSFSPAVIFRTRTIADICLQYWRRRFFTLNGSKFTAYHEATRQPRATINLAKASKLIDDKSALTQKETSAKSGGRRKSAFAEEEEGYMFVEEGFRIRFANGETIDFYADSASDKEGWMKALADVVGKDSSRPKLWTDLVLAKQKAVAAKAQAEQQKATPARSAPTPPAKTEIRRSYAPPPVEKDPRHAVIEQRRQAAKQKTRSMIF